MRLDIVNNDLMSRSGQLSALLSHNKLFFIKSEQFFMTVNNDLFGHLPAYSIRICYASVNTDLTDSLKSICVSQHIKVYFKMIRDLYTRCTSLPHLVFFAE